MLQVNKMGNGLKYHKIHMYLDVKVMCALMKTVLNMHYALPSHSRLLRKRMKHEWPILSRKYGHTHLIAFSLVKISVIAHTFLKGLLQNQDFFVVVLK